MKGNNAGFAMLTGALLLSASVGATPASAERRFPADPTGRWTIEYQETTPSTPHRLLLKDRQTNRASLFYEFDRDVRVLWAPDGSALAITDHSGSNQSEIYVVDPKNLGKRIDVQRLLVASLEEFPAWYENGHCYFEATEWSTPTLLRFQVRAYDARPGEEYRGSFELELRTGTIRQVADPST